MEGNGNEQSPKQPGLLQDRASQIPCDPFPPFFIERVYICKSGAAHKAEQPHLWRVIKPQSGERGGEAAAKQESLRLRSSAPCHKPSIPALRGAHHLDQGRGKQRFRCDECAPRTLTEPHSKEPHSMLIRAFARARNRETGARNCDTLHNEI